MLKKTVATIVISTFILTMPGAQFYQAWGQGTSAGSRSAALGRAQAARMLKIPALPGASMQENLDFQRRFLKDPTALNSVKGQASAAKRPSVAARKLKGLSALSGEVSSRAKDPRASPAEVKAKAGEAFEAGSSGTSCAPDTVSGRRGAAERSALNNGRGAFRASLKPFPANRPLASAWVSLSSQRGATTKGRSSKRGAVRVDWMLALPFLAICPPLAFFIILFAQDRRRAERRSARFDWMADMLD